MIPIYRWKLNVAGTIYDVRPAYKDELALVYERESQQRFFRRKLSSKISFIADDADLVIAAPFETDFKLDLQVSEDMGLTWRSYYLSHFHKTDCTINYDDRKVQVQPEVSDQYNEVLAGLDKEFNLIELAPVIQPVGMTKRPMFQLYTGGEDICSCFCGGESFEQDMAETSEGRIRECGFDTVGNSWEFNFPNPPVSGFENPFGGEYHGNGSTFRADGSPYYLTYFESMSGAFMTNGVWIYRDGTENPLWVFEQTYPYVYGEIPAEFTFTQYEGSGMPNMTAYKFVYNFFGRYVLDRNDVQGLNVIPLPTDDVVINNRNYHYCAPFTLFTVTQSRRVSTEPTKWGRNDRGEYFLPPDDNHNWLPVGRSQWVNTSMWIYYTTAMSSIEQNGRKHFVLKDAFPLWSVIAVLLKAVGSDVTFEGTAEYSEFLYGDVRWLDEKKERLFLAPKSNIIVGEYQEPAMKAPTTIGDILKMLQKVYNCYWFIDEQNRLRIEHISWFKKGGSYESEPVVGLDLTKTFNVRNNKDWAYLTSEVKFNKEDMPERYQYEWMDDCTEMFNGKPVNILSTFVQEGKVEEVTVSGFTSDVDYMLLAPDMCSKDGFALLGARDDGHGNYNVLIFDLGFDSFSGSSQNYYLSMNYLIDSYLISDMPSWNIAIGNTERQAAGIQRNKQQTINFPVALNVDLTKLIRTHIGNGEVDRAEINLSSRMGKVQLKYDTYDRE